MRAIALVALAALVLPAVAAQDAPARRYDYPQPLVDLLPSWIQDAEALARGSEGAPWWPETEGFLAKAKDAHRDGRFRVAVFHLETFHELLLAHRLMDEANASFASEAQKKTFILGRTQAWHADAEDAWLDYRARLHALDGELRSLRSVERALYSADVALQAIQLADDHELLARDFQQGGAVSRGYALALVRASHTPLLVVGYAGDMLDPAVRDEGLPPRLLDEPWANVTSAALDVEEGGQLPPYLETLEKRAAPARANGEALLAVTAALAEARAERAQGMSTIFGDASSRGKDVVGDATRGMLRQLNNTTVERVRAYGLDAVFTSDAIDRALFTQEFVERGLADVGTLVAGWAALEHQAYVATALAAASPVRPPENETPAPGALAALAAVGAAALLARSRRA